VRNFPPATMAVPFAPGDGAVIAVPPGTTPATAA